MKHLRYLAYVLKHKWFVFVAGMRVGAPLWRLIIHDWSKFTAAEWGPYVERFHGINRNGEQTRANFERAVKLHLARNDHHWQFWFDEQTHRMSVVAELEMVADWAGAGRAKRGQWDVAEWYRLNRFAIVLDPLSRKRVEALIDEYFSPRDFGTAKPA